MKKFLKCITITVVAAVLCIAVLLAGCSTSDTVGISGIEKTASDGNVDTYTIYYTDGSTYDYTVTNGTDGKDGSNGVDGNDGAISVEELYETYKTFYGDDLTYSEFLDKYLSNVSVTTSTATDTVSSINSCLLSAASVYSEYECEYSYSTGFRPGSSGTSTTIEFVTYATGSAILYEKGVEYSYFVTNYHVVYEYESAYNINGIADRIYIYLYGSEDTPTETYNTSGYLTSLDYGNYAIECEYVGGSLKSDIAVLRVKTADIDAINPDFKAVKIADGYHVGESVFTIGNAEGEGLSVTEGIISVDSENISLSIDGINYNSYRSIRIDAAVYGGNSGGGLFNSNGELVGLVNAGDSTDQNINYAIPITIVTGTADNIIYYYKNGDGEAVVSYGVTLGIGYTTENSKYVYDSVSGYGEIMEDVIISSVTADSIAETIGFEVGDVLEKMIITDADGVTKTYEITRSFNVTDLLLTLREGYKISFTYTRGGETGTTSEYTITSSDLTARA